MAEQAETAFVKTYLSTITNQPITYGDDYQQPLQNSLKRVPVLPIPLPPPPERKQKLSDSSAGSGSINLTFKSLKPPQSFSLSVQPTETIQSIKALLASQPKAPPADVQRLLLKGKALADTKLLKEYNIKEGDTVNLMVKPGYTWNPNSPTPPPTTAPTMASESTKETKTPHLGHSRIPSVVLSPSPSQITPNSDTDTQERPLDINLTLDTSSIPTASSEITHKAYHATVSQPQFWERLLSFVRAEFTTENDALLAFEDFLRASKGTLSASEIAKIRDHVGVVGMAGT